MVPNRYARLEPNQCFSSISALLRLYLLHYMYVKLLVLHTLTCVFFQQDTGAAAASVKSKPTERECENKKKTNNCVPPDPGPQCNSVATESSDSCDDLNDDDDDDEDSLVDELEVGLFSASVSPFARVCVAPAHLSNNHNLQCVFINSLI